MVAGSNLSWQGIKREAVYTEGAGPVCKCTGQCTPPFYNPLHLIRDILNQMSKMQSCNGEVL